MSARPYDRGAVLLGIGAVLSVLFTFSTSGNNNFVSVGGFGVIVLLVLGGAAIAAGATGNPTVVLGAGLVLVLGAFALFVLIPFETDAVSGDGFFRAQASTMSLYAGLGIAMSVLGLLGRAYPDGVDAVDPDPASQHW